MLKNMSFLHEFRSFAYTTIRSSFFCHFSVFLTFIFRVCQRNRTNICHFSQLLHILFRNSLTRCIAYLEMWLTHSAHTRIYQDSRHTQIHIKQTQFFKLFFLKIKNKFKYIHRFHTIGFLIRIILELYFSRSCSYRRFYISSPCIRLTAIIAIATCISLNNMFKMAFLRNILLPEIASKNNNNNRTVHYQLSNFDTLVEIIERFYD